MTRDKQNQSPGKHWDEGRPWPGGQLVAGSAGSGSGWRRPRECQRCRLSLASHHLPSPRPYARLSHRNGAGLTLTPVLRCRRGHLVPTSLVTVFQSSLWQFTVNCSNEGKPLNMSPPKEHRVLDSVFLCRMHLMVFDSCITHQISDIMQS